MDGWSDRDEADFMRIMKDVTGLPPSKLTADRRLLHDLGVDGDDASELLDALMKRFRLDVSDFPFQDHFFGEPSLLSLFVRQSIKTRKPLTIGELRSALVTGRLA